MDKKVEENLVELSKVLDKFKKESNVTYVYILGRMSGEFVEIPYSYKTFMSFGRKQQEAICQAELLKLHRSPEIVHFDPDKFFLTKEETDWVVYKKKIDEVKQWFDNSHSIGNFPEDLRVGLLGIINEKKSKPYLEEMITLAKYLFVEKYDEQYSSARDDFFKKILADMAGICQEKGESYSNLYQEIKELVRLGYHLDIDAGEIIEES